MTISPDDARFLEEMKGPHPHAQVYEGCETCRLLRIVEGLREENKDLRDALESIEAEVSQVYCHITNGKLSKANYLASEVIAASDDITSEMLREEVAAVESKLADAEARIKEMEEIAAKWCSPGEMEAKR